MPKIHSPAAMEIGRRIRETRRRIGISLEDLGELAEVSWTTIGKIERGVQSPAAETIVRIATALETDPGRFLAGISADHYGRRPHRITARELIEARNGNRGAAAEKTLQSGLELTHRPAGESTVPWVPAAAGEAAHGFGGPVRDATTTGPRRLASGHLREAPGGPTGELPRAR